MSTLLTLIKYIFYVKMQNKCTKCKGLLHDPSVAGNSNLRECGSCGLMWGTAK